MRCMGWFWFRPGVSFNSDLLPVVLDKCEYFGWLDDCRWNCSVCV